jgi:hypothetical protein
VAEPERDREIAVGYWPDKQDWFRFLDNEQAATTWLGIVKGHAPRPEDLSRDEGCDLNIGIVLGDGNRWYLPVARPASLAKTLPRCFGLGRDGAGTTEVMPAYSHIEELGETLFERVRSGGGIGMSDEEMVREASACLGVNYRVSETECRALRLWDRKTLQVALLSLIDYGTWGMEKNGEATAEGAGSVD